jgi:hypothetical protein
VPLSKNVFFYTSNDSAAIVLDSAVSPIDSAGLVPKIQRPKINTLEVPLLKNVYIITITDSAEIVLDSAVSPVNSAVSPIDSAGLVPKIQRPKKNLEVKLLKNVYIITEINSAAIVLDSASSPVDSAAIVLDSAVSPIDSAAIVLDSAVSPIDSASPIPKIQRPKKKT